MTKKFDKQLLRRIRNDIEINVLIEHILQMDWRIRENYFRFLCPLCGEFNTATNPTTNLGRCFCCGKNFNPIDLVMIYKRYAFTDAVNFLSQNLQPKTGRQKSRQAPKGNQEKEIREKCGVSKSGKTNEQKRKNQSISEHLISLRKHLEAKRA